MKKWTAVLPLAAAVLAFSGCTSGPHQLTRTVDDWDNRLYVESPWMNGLLHVVPVIPFAGAVAATLDFFVTDAVAFWLEDAWDCKGTGFDHLKVDASESVESLLIEGSGWMRQKQR